MFNKAFRGFFAAVLAVVFLSSAHTGYAQLVCQLSGAPVVQTGALTVADATQAGRINRNGITGSCPTGKTNSLFSAAAVIQDNYTFVAPVTGCANIDFNATQCGGATTQAAVYSTYNPATPGNNVISDFGFSTTATASFGFPVTSGQSYTVVIHDIVEAGTNLLCGNYSFTITYRTSCRAPGFDQTNDGMADPVVFSPASGNWSTLNSGGANVFQNFGVSSDVLTAADYTGDGQTDVSVYRPSTNQWFYGNNTVNPGMNFTVRPWGSAGDVAVPGDYDADGKSDIAVWRPSNGIWYVIQSSDSTVSYSQWGASGDVPVTGDFDGDLKADLVIVRPNEVGTNYSWYFLNSNFARGFPLRTVWGIAGDIIAPGDFDGNGKMDMTVFRPSDGVWYTRPSIAQNAIATTSTGFKWGLAGDIPQPADYDGDGRTDFAVFRPSTGVWYLNNSGSNTFSTPSWGTATDRPATAPMAVTP